MGQLFVEAVLIALVAMALGLALADQVSPLVVAKIESELGQSFPFWIDFGVNPHLVLPALPVAVVAAVLAGVVPALKLTGKGVLTGLKRSGSGASVRFGKAATLLVIVQIALAVGLLSVAVGARVGVKSAARDHRGLGIDPDRYLYASLAVPLRIPTSKELRGGDYSQAARVRAQEVWTELDARLSVEPGVRGVAWGTNLPAESHPSVSIEVQGNSADRDGRTHRIRRAVVDVEFFRGLGAPILRGRGFDVSDAEGGSRFVIVNSNFVRRVLGGAEPIGQRFRYLRREGDEPAPWFEIVGVVGSLGVDVHEPGADEAVYHPMKPGYAVKVAIELSGDPTLFASRLRELTAEVAPTVLLRRTQPLTDVLHKAFADARIGGLTAGLVAMISTLLSAAGLFAIVSFTVAQRTRELGIRSALGATSVRILTTVFQRAFLQTSAGILGGIVFAGAFVSVVFAEVEKDGVNWLATVGGVVVFMLLVVLAACLRPALRGLRIQPTEALREG